MTARKKTAPKKSIDDAAAGPSPPAESDDLHQASFPIVGIGASAGGLAAFEAFFSAMPDGDASGMAFVVVQHLAPDYKSILADLIGRYTRMKVFEVEHGMAVEPNCIYIIPPNRDMAFLNGTLQLLEPGAPRGHRCPIDFFSARWPRISMRAQSALYCRVLAATVRREYAPLKPRTAW